MSEISDNSVTLTLTDIPYAVINRPSNGLRSLDKKNADVATFSLKDFVDGIVRITSGSIYIFCSTEQVSELRSLLIENGLTTRLCVWEKTNPTPLNGQYLWLSGVECCVFGKKKGAAFNEFCKNTVWRYPVGRNRHHPTEKPLALFEYLVKVSSNAGDVVFDPCVGGGTTAVAAKNQGRRFLACDLDPVHVWTSMSRLITG